MASDAVFAVGVIAFHLLVCVGPAAFTTVFSRSANNHEAEPGRTSYWDNIRFFCELQVVFSHYVLFLGDVPTGGKELVWPRGRFDDAASWDLAWPSVIYEMTMLWRMPVFAFMTGLMSKGELNEVRSERLLINVVAPMFLYVGGFFGYAIGGSWQNPIMTDKIDALWFLSAVVIWRLSINVIRPFSAGSTVVLGVMISAFAPYFFKQGPYNEDNAFAYKMALTFYFAFAAGFALEIRTPQLKTFNSWRLRGVCACGLLAITLAFSSSHFVGMMDYYTADLYTMDDKYTKELFTYVNLPEGSVENPNYLRLRHVFGYTWAWIPRLVSMVIAVISGAIACLAIPQMRTWYSDAGKRNMYAYMLHMVALVPLHNLMAAVVPFKKLSREQNSAKYCVDPDHNLLVWFPYLLIMPLVLTFSLSTLPVRLLTWPVIEPTWIKLFLPGSERYTQNGFSQIHTLAPSHLCLHTPARFRLWAACEVFVLGLVIAIRKVSPVNGPRWLWGGGALVITAFHIAEMAFCLPGKLQVVASEKKKD
jgi:hypothetical protein